MKHVFGLAIAAAFYIALTIGAFKLGCRLLGVA